MRAAPWTAAIALLALESTGAAGQAMSTCRVADNTGSPLNVRQGPQGRVVGTLRNGTMVRIAATARDHKQQTWVQVVEGQRGRTVGWVLRDHLSCY